LGVFFADAATEYVVEVFGFARLAADFAQTVKTIPAEFGDLLTLLLFNRIAAGVAFVMGFGVLLKIIGVGKELNPLRAKESRINFTLTLVILTLLLCNITGDRINLNSTMLNALKAKKADLTLLYPRSY
jgi:hypothetical protein